MENNPASKYRIASGVALVLIILAALAWYISRPAGSGTSLTELSTTTLGSTSTTQDGLITTGGSYTVGKDDIVDLPTPPDFRAPVAFAAAVSPEVRAVIESRIKLLQEKLSKDSFDLGAWIDFGTLHKMGGDYRGAETAWLFVTKAAPQNSIAFANLADLYMNFLKDYPKADIMYKQVSALAPDVIDAYISLALLYENFYKAGGSPEAVLKLGVAANPKSIELELALARYYTRTNRPADAKAAYQAAINIAQADGNTPLISQIKSEAGL